MAEVHAAITAHSTRQNKIVRTFFLLDQKREAAIEEAIRKCKRKESFTVDQINEITKEMRKLSSTGIVPVRQLVTKEMVAEYVYRKQ